MKNKLLLALAFLSLSTTAFALDSDSEESKNHLGIIASPSLDKLFRDNRSLPVGLIYKRKVKENQAFRLTATGQYNKFGQPLNKVDNLMQHYDHSNFSGRIALGYEWQQKLNNRFQFYYGTDAGVGYVKTSQEANFEENYDVWQNEIVVVTHNRLENQQTLSYFLKPLVGLQFKIHPKLYLATETSLYLQHSRFTGDFEHHRSFNNGAPDHKMDHAFENRSTSVWYQPLSNIQLVYKF